jgi:hypothetical protein
MLAFLRLHRDVDIRQASQHIIVVQALGIEKVRQISAQGRLDCGLARLQHQS